MVSSHNFTNAIRLTAAALCVSVLAATGASRAADSPQPPPQARAMTAYELLTIYGDRSWQWADGAGRLETDDRRFTAITGSGGAANWAEGRWLITDRGRLCLVADWHIPSGSFPARTCFDHRRAGDTIYQRRLPEGAWYVFRHAPVAANDEFAKLVREDLVSARLDEARSAPRAARLSSAPSISGVNGNE